MRPGYKQTEVGVIPEDWGIACVGDAFEVCNNLRLPISQAVREQMLGDYPYYGPTNIQGWINEFRVEGEFALIGEDGDHFLKWRTQPMTLLVRGRFNVNNHAHLVRGSKNLTAWFYWYFVNRDITTSLTRQGASRYKLNKATLLQLPCVLPPPPEQEAIAEALSDADGLSESLEQLLVKKRQIKQGAMPELLTGKKRLPGFSGEWEVKRVGDFTDLQRYRELAEAEWSKIKPRKQNGRDFDSHRFRITHIMEKLAEASGDVEELVAVKARDLSSGYSYFTIAEILGTAGQDDKALDWAERGLKAFPDRPDNRLRDFLAAAYLKRKRHDEALHLTWIQFEERPGLEYYKKLHGVAKHLGIWPDQRSRALALVSDISAREAAKTSHWKPKPSIPDHSLRVEIALWEKDLDAAWAAVQEGGCDRNLLIALAEKLEPERPNEAIALYRRVVPLIVEQTNNAAYDEAIKLIRRGGKLMSAQKRSGEFADYLAELRVRFKPKRNFIKLLDGVARAFSTG